MKTITMAEIDAYVAEHNQDESSFVRPALSYTQTLLDRVNGKAEEKNGSINLPWSKTADQISLRHSEVTLWLGINGHGKSILLGQVFNHIMRQGMKCCIASLEMRPEATLHRMVRQASTSKYPTDDYIKDYLIWTEHKLWIYDQHGTTAPHRIVNLCKYVVSLGVNHIVLDSLMKIVASEDDYNAQKGFVDQICILARDTGLHIHLVHHSRKGADENKAPGKMDAKGSGAITDLVDNCISIWRRKERVEDKPDCILTVDKQRHGEWEGKIGLWYEEAGQNFCETENRKFAHIDVNDNYSGEF